MANQSTTKGGTSTQQQPSSRERYGPEEHYGSSQGASTSQTHPQTQGGQGQHSGGQQGRTMTRSGGGSMTPYSSYGYSSPFALMRRLSDEMDRMFEGFGFGSGLFGREPWGGSLATSGGQGGPGMQQLWWPNVEVSQRGDKMVVQADLPGVRKEDVNVEIEDDQIVIQGQRKQEREDNQGGYYHSERSYGSFYRAIPLPEGVDPDNARATFRDGVLEIELDAPRQGRRGRTLQIQDASGTGGSTLQGSSTQGSTRSGVSGGGSSGGSAGSV